MSVIKTYIASNLDDAIYEIRSDFNNQKIQCIYSPKEDQFKEAHIPTLVSGNAVIALVGIDKIKYDLISSTLKLNNTKSIVWVFKKLAKNTKIYKEIKQSIPIHHCLNLSKTKDKKQFIEGLVNKFSIPRKYIPSIIERSGDDKSIIYQEIKKLSVAIKSTDDPLNSFISDHADLDALFFVDNLLKRNLVESLKYYSKLKSKTQYHQICYLLGKQITCYIHLCQNDVPAALSVWKIPEWLINQKQGIAKNFGLFNLCNLYNRITEELYNYEAGRNPELAMRKLIWDICR